MRTSQYSPRVLSAALQAVAAKVDDACLLPVQHACEGPDALTAHFRPRLPEWIAKLSEKKRSKLDFDPVPSCALCWRNAKLRAELGPGFKTNISDNTKVIFF